MTPTRPLLLALITPLALLSITPAQARDPIEIKSGVSGTYCTPFDDPRCRSHNAQSAERAWEKRQFERRMDDQERRERERDFERRMERDRLRDNDRRY